jgi:hypothetical protein
MPQTAESALRNLADARHLHNRRPALAVGKARGFVLVRVHTPELLAISVEHRNQIMVVLATTIFLEARLAFVVRSLRSSFHDYIPELERC